MKSAVPMRQSTCPNETGLSCNATHLNRGNAGLTPPATKKPVGVPAPDGTISHRFGCFSKRPLPKSLNEMIDDVPMSQQHRSNEPKPCDEEFNTSAGFKKQSVLLNNLTEN